MIHLLKFSEFILKITPYDYVGHVCDDPLRKKRKGNYNLSEHLQSLYKNLFNSCPKKGRVEGRDLIGGQGTVRVPTDHGI